MAIKTECIATCTLESGSPSVPSTNSSKPNIFEPDGQVTVETLRNEATNQKPVFSARPVGKNGRPLSQGDIEKQEKDLENQLEETRELMFQQELKNSGKIQSGSNVPVKTNIPKLPQEISDLPKGNEKFRKTAEFFAKEEKASRNKPSAKPLKLEDLTNEVTAKQVNTLSLNLKSKKKTFWQNCITNKNSVHETSAEVKSVEVNTLPEPKNLSVKAKKELLPFSSLWTTPIAQLFLHKATGLSNDYKSITTPKNDGKKGICKSGDEKARNLWSTELCRAAPGTAEEGASIANPVEGVESKESVSTTTNVDSSNSKKRIFAGLRSAAWIPTSGKWGSTLGRQWIRLKTWMGCDNPPGEQRLEDTMKAVLELQADDPGSAAYKAINHTSADSSETNPSPPPGSSEKNPLTLSMFSNSLVSGCVIGGTDPEGYLQDMQLRLIEYANSKDAFELKVKDNTNNEKSVWVKPDIMMLSAPVQERDRWLMSGSLGLLGRRNHTSNMNAVAQLEQKHSAYRKEKFAELERLVTGDEHQAACELALNIRADQELMKEILEMAAKPKDLKSGMYGSNDGNPHAFNARMAVLASRMGITPITNCKTGKDRTEDSLVAQQLLAAEIDDNIQRQLQKKTSVLKAELRKNSNKTVSSDFLDSIIYDANIPLVPRRDFLSAENLKKEIQKSEADDSTKQAINAVLEDYHPQKLGQYNLHDTINRYGHFFKFPIPDDTNKILDEFERTAHRRMAFSLSEAGFTIQMLNNKIEEKKELIWGNKQPRYSDYYFGLSKDEIDAHKKFMKPPVSVGA